MIRNWMLALAATLALTLGAATQAQDQSDKLKRLEQVVESLEKDMARQQTMLKRIANALQGMKAESAKPASTVKAVAKPACSKCTASKKCDACSAKKTCCDDKCDKSTKAAACPLKGACSKAKGGKACDACPTRKACCGKCGADKKGACPMTGKYGAKKCPLGFGESGSKAKRDMVRHKLAELNKHVDRFLEETRTSDTARESMLVGIDFMLLRAKHHLEQGRENPHCVQQMLQKISQHSQTARAAWATVTSDPKKVDKVLEIMEGMNRRARWAIEASMKDDSERDQRRRQMALFWNGWAQAGLANARKNPQLQKMMISKVDKALNDLSAKTAKAAADPEKIRHGLDRMIGKVDEMREKLHWLRENPEKVNWMIARLQDANKRMGVAVQAFLGESDSKASHHHAAEAAKAKEAAAAARLKAEQQAHDKRVEMQLKSAREQMERLRRQIDALEDSLED